MTITIREMQPTDYSQAYKLWLSVPGMKLEKADSEAGVKKYLSRNPKLSYVAEIDNKIIGTILCGEDGRRGYMQHLSVTEQYREKGIGKSLLSCALQQFKKLDIQEVRIFIFKNNDIGNSFWQDLGWSIRDDIYVRTVEL